MASVRASEENDDLRPPQRRFRAPNPCPLFRYVKREGDYENKLDGMELWRKFRLGLYDPQTDFAMLEMKQT